MPDAMMIDTSGWIALSDGSHELHKEAQRVWAHVRKNPLTLLTTDYIIMDSLQEIFHSHSFSSAKIFGELISSSKILNVHPIDEQLRNKAWELFIQANGEIDYLCATTIACMQALKVNCIFTFYPLYSKYNFLTIP